MVNDQTDLCSHVKEAEQSLWAHADDNIALLRNVLQPTFLYFSYSVLHETFPGYVWSILLHCAGLWEDWALFLRIKNKILAQTPADKQSYLLDGYIVDSAMSGAVSEEIKTIVETKH